VREFEDRLGEFVGRQIEVDSIRRRDRYDRNAKDKSDDYDGEN
jgi:hypothetical protein